MDEQVRFSPKALTEELNRKRGKFLKPTVPKPSIEELEEMAMNFYADCTDGCLTEVDGDCCHGHVSWLVYLKLI